MSQPETVRPLIAAGMARQLAAYHEALAAGMPRLGWKIGINDPAAQQRMGIAATLVGWLDGRRWHLLAPPAPAGCVARLALALPAEIELVPLEPFAENSAFDERNSAGRHAP